eukprot:scaffold79463_cov26-Tisochrysis_lutea.AAC.3
MGSAETRGRLSDGDAMVGSAVSNAGTSPTLPDELCPLISPAIALQGTLPILLEHLLHRIIPRGKGQHDENVPKSVARKAGKALWVDALWQQREEGGEADAIGRKHSEQPWNHDVKILFRGK